MGGHSGVGLAFVLIASGCSTGGPPPRDLARGGAYYSSPAFEALTQQAVQAYIAPLKDARKDPQQPEGDVVAEFVKEGWDRSVRVMVEEILRDEIGKSGIYAGIINTAASNALIIEPTLMVLYGAWETRQGGFDDYGSRTYALAAIRIKIYGPADANGKRLVWLNKELRQLVASKFQRSTPPSLPSLTGVALSQAMGQVLEAVYTADGRDARPERAATTQPLNTNDPKNAKNTNKN